MVERVADKASGGELRAGEVLGDARHAPGGEVEGGHIRPGMGQLQRLAAGGRAEIEDMFARQGGQHLHGEGGGGVLHPPVAAGITRQGRDLAGVAQPDRAGGQDDAAQPFDPALGIGFDRQIQRRAREMRALHRGDGGLAPGLGERVTQPGGQAGHAQVVPGSRGVLGHLAQDGVDQPLEAAKAGVLGDDPDGLVHDAVRIAALRQFHRARAQDVEHRQRRRFAQVPRQEAVGARQPAQRIGGQPLCAGAVGGRQGIQSATRDEIGQEAALAQYLIEQMHGGGAGGGGALFHRVVLGGGLEAGYISGVSTRKARP